MKHCHFQKTMTSTHLQIDTKRTSKTTHIIKEKCWRIKKEDPDEEHQGHSGGHIYKSNAG